MNDSDEGRDVPDDAEEYGDAEDFERPKAKPPTRSGATRTAPTLTPGQAQRRVDAIVAAAAENSLHPLMDASHPAYEETYAEFLRLNGIAAGAPPAGALPMPDLPGSEPAHQPVVTGASTLNADTFDYVSHDGVEADKPVQDLLRSVGQEFGSAQPEWALLGRLAALRKSGLPATSDQEFLAQLQAAWRGADFQLNLDKVDRVFEWTEARFAKAPKAERERIDAQLEWASTSLEGCEALVAYYDDRWARANDTFVNFHAGLESAKQQAEDRARAEAAVRQRRADAEANEARAAFMSATARAHERWGRTEP